ncbi:hypothetical protein AgCh_033902 [Apium graveolens]
MLGINEISGGREHWTPDMQVFKDCVTDLGLGHVRTLGELFTWTNKRPQDPVLKRLDRMIANALWFNTFTEGNAVVHHRGIMDHNPLLYEEPLQVKHFGKPIQFFNFMFDLPGFASLISRAWSLDLLGNPMKQFNFKLKNAKQALRVFNKEHGNLHNIVHIMRTQLAEQCKANWTHNKVLSLENENGDLVYGQQECANVDVSYYQGLLANVATHGYIDISSITCNTVTNDQSSALVAPMTGSLILKTLKSMKRNKALGPDGVNVEFFISTWDITCPSICEPTPSGFHHHWKCRELNISHLFFVDDMLSFAKGSKDSVLHIMDNLAKFSVWSGLNPSVHKSNSFLYNCNPEFVAWFDETYAIPRGTLPVRFLGVPLISSQLYINDCIPLIKRITSKLNSWANLLLSLAGRALLIKTFVHAIQAFWSNHFLLPSAVHQHIQSKLTRFLWKGNINHRGGAKVAWDALCLPKAEGGLDASKIKTWHIWEAIRYHRPVVPWYKAVKHHFQINKINLREPLLFDMLRCFAIICGEREMLEPMIEGSLDVAFRTPLTPYEKLKFLGSGGSMVTRMKLKGIDGRAPPGVEPVA